MQEIVGTLSRRDYSNARLRAGLLREGTEVKLIGATCILSNAKTQEFREHDYGSLILVEFSLSKENFGSWLARLVKEGSVEFGMHVVAVKGDFESRLDISQRVVPSSSQFYPFSPVEWACTIFRYRLAIQAGVPYSLEPKIELPFYPDGRTAWGDWVGIDPPIEVTFLVMS